MTTNFCQAIHGKYDRRITDEIIIDIYIMYNRWIDRQNHQQTCFVGEFIGLYQHSSQLSIYIKLKFHQIINKYKFSQI
jgi:hypothetical protein